MFLDMKFLRRQQLPILSKFILLQFKIVPKSHESLILYIHYIMIQNFINSICLEDTCGSSFFYVFQTITLPESILSMIP